MDIWFFCFFLYVEVIIVLFKVVIIIDLVCENKEVLVLSFLIYVFIIKVDVLEDNFVYKFFMFMRLLYYVVS